MIQDKIIAACLVTFAFSLVPQIVRNYRGKTCGVVWQTSLMTALASYVVAGCLASLGLWFAGAVNFTLASMWAAMLWQWYAYRPKLTRCGDCRHYWLVEEQCRITRKKHWGEDVCGRYKERSE